MTQPWMNTYWTEGHGALYKADAREIPLPDKSVHCVVTSPPYWGLRDYGLLEWEGGDTECNHAFGRVGSARANGIVNESKAVRNRDGASAAPTECKCGARQVAGGIGLEPTLDAWVEDIVAVMREVWRVLRDDGIVWLNLGDAYTSGGRPTFRSSRSKNKGHQVQDDMARPQTSEGLKPKDLMGQPWKAAFALQEDGANVSALRIIEGIIDEFYEAFDGEEIPPKALAILKRLETEYTEAKGNSWVLRSAIIWHKPNPMPESTSDRPTSAYEVVFLLAKSGTAQFWTHRDHRGTRERPAPDYRWIHKSTDKEWAERPNGWHLKRYCPGDKTGCSLCQEWRRLNLWSSHDYFYDAEAIRTPWAEASVQRLAQPTFDSQEGGPKDTKSGNRSHRKVLENLKQRHPSGWADNPSYSGQDPRYGPRPDKQGGHGRRHAGFNARWDVTPEEEHETRGANARNVWTIAPQPRKEAHFATFPDELVQRCVLAGTSAKGVCGECSAPWVRQIEKEYKGGHNVAHTPRADEGAGPSRASNFSRDGLQVDGDYQTQTLGWQPTCDHSSAPVPAIVLDPFVGSGTTVAVAQSLGRCGIGLDLNAEYLDIAVKRITSGKYDWTPKEESHEQTKETEK